MPARLSGRVPVDAGYATRSALGAPCPAAPHPRPWSVMAAAVVAARRADPVTGRLRSELGAAAARDVQPMPRRQFPRQSALRGVFPAVSDPSACGPGPCGRPGRTGSLRARFPRSESAWGPGPLSGQYGYIRLNAIFDGTVLDEKTLRPESASGAIHAPRPAPGPGPSPRPSLSALQAPVRSRPVRMNGRAVFSVFLK
jgi:hypothetical protein